MTCCSLAFKFNFQSSSSKGIITLWFRQESELTLLIYGISRIYSSPNAKSWVNSAEYQPSSHCPKYLGLDEIKEASYDESESVGSGNRGSGFEA